MPWSVAKDDRCPASKPYGVVKDDDEELEGCHASEDDAKKQLAALYANEAGRLSRPPRDNLVRAMRGEYAVSESDDGPPTLTGHFAVFDEWTHIDSTFEGQFLERIAPGAFAKTITENRSAIKVLFQHGQDAQVGDKPIASIQTLREDERGAYYEATLLEGVPPLVVSGLKAGQYGASFRFRVIKEDFDHTPKKSATNPDAWPERTIREAQVFEFGPVTFPAYIGATAGMRSLTDLYHVERFTRDPAQLRQLLEAVKALPDGAALHSAPESRPTVAQQPRFHSRDEWLAYLTGEPV